MRLTAIRQTWRLAIFLLASCILSGNADPWPLTALSSVPCFAPKQDWASKLDPRSAAMLWVKKAPACSCGNASRQRASTWELASTDTSSAAAVAITTRSTRSTRPLCTVLNTAHKAHSSHTTTTTSPPQPVRWPQLYRVGKISHWLALRARPPPLPDRRPLLVQCHLKPVKLRNRFRSPANRRLQSILQKLGPMWVLAVLIWSRVQWPSHGRPRLVPSIVSVSVCWFNALSNCLVSTAQVWPVHSNTPGNVLHTFRPPIFSLFSTYRPPSVPNIYVRPTVRPPIVVKPTSVYQQIFNTRSTTTSTPLNATLTPFSTNALHVSSITTTPVQTTSSPTSTPTTRSPTTSWQSGSSSVSETSAIVSQTYTKRPFISSKGL